MRYEEEFKAQIIETFFESGDSVRKFADAYGMSRNTLFSWIKDDPRHEVVSRKAPWRKYPPEYKYQAVQMVIVDGLSSHKVAEIMGCKHGPLVSTWVRAYKKKGLIGLEPPVQPIGKKKPDTKRARKSKTTSLEEYVRELESENEKLEKEVNQLRFEADVAHTIAEVRSKKGGGLDVSLLSNAEKTEVIDMLRPKYLLKDLLGYLDMAPSSYEYRKQIQDRPDKYAREREVILEVFFENKGVYGYRRVAEHANKDYGDINVSERIAKRIMREEELVAKQASKKSYSSYKGEVGKVAPNVLNRNFNATVPYSKIGTDVSVFKVCKKKIYFSPLIDFYNGEAISYSVSFSPTVEFVLGMFDRKTKKKLKGKQCLAHSDQGFQYQHVAYQSMLEELGCTQSMSRKGNCLDNGLVESFFARLKTEFFYGSKFESVEQFLKDLDEYIWWYNNKRIKMGLGGLSPVEYRERYCKAAA